MRLLNVRTLQLTEFLDAKQRPRFVIASHRWGRHEATYKDLTKGRNKDTDGYKKIEDFASYVRQHLPGVDWLWIDTCCINKASDAELSYAINSMFNWYRDAELCIARLADVTAADDLEQFRNDQWFRRGWTLQELLAPRTVLFVDAAWQTIGHKGSIVHDAFSAIGGPDLAASIARATGIPGSVLHDWSASVNTRLDEKMKWMSGRDTTREEDMVYALFGIVGVSMSVIYGEGKERASARLISAIQSRDSTAAKYAQQTRQVVELLSSPASGTDQNPFRKRTSTAPKSVHDVLTKRLQDGNTLQKAASAGDDRVVRLLLSGGADPDSRDQWNGTALITACERGHCEIVKILLAAGADACAKAGNHPNCRLALPIAAKSADGGEMVKMLLDAGADPNSRDASSITALYSACQRNDSAVVKILLNAGADVNAVTDRQWGTDKSNVRKYKALEAAARLKDNGNIAKMLLDAGAIDSEEEALWAAAYSRNDSTLQVILNSGIKSGAYGAKTLSRAISENSAYLIENLLLTGSFSDEEILSALYTVPRYSADGEALGHILAKGLSRNGASVAAHDAAGGGHAQILQMLLNAHVDIINLPHLGKSLLHRAVEKRDHTAVKVLLERGATYDTQLWRKMSAELGKYPLPPITNQEASTEMTDDEAADRLPAGIAGKKAAKHDGSIPGAIRKILEWQERLLRRLE